MVGGGYEITVSSPVMFGVLLAGGTYSSIIAGTVAMLGTPDTGNISFKVDSSTPLLASAFLGGVGIAGGGRYPNQTLINLQQLAANVSGGRGITVEEAKILKDIGFEAGLTVDGKDSDVHGPEIHLGRTGWGSKNLHLSIGTKKYLITDPENFRRP